MLCTRPIHKICSSLQSHFPTHHAPKASCPEPAGIQLHKPRPYPHHPHYVNVGQYSLPFQAQLHAPDTHNTIIQNDTVKTARTVLQTLLCATLIQAHLLLGCRTGLQRLLNQLDQKLHNAHSRPCAIAAGDLKPCPRHGS